MPGKSIMDTAQQTAITKRLMELHSRQSECYHRLIGVLEKQQVFIGTGSEESILAHIGLGEQIIAEIFTIQKTIDPLEVMCNADTPLASDLLAIKAGLDSLNSRAMAQSEQNKKQLSQRMANLRSEINILGNNPIAKSARRSLYAQVSTPTLIDIRG